MDGSRWTMVRAVLLMLLSLVALTVQQAVAQPPAISSGTLTVIQPTNSSLNQPIDVAVDTQGALYIADMDNNRVIKLLPNGTLLTSYTPTLSTLGLSQPEGVAVDSAGVVWIADSNNGRVLAFANNGQQLQQLLNTTTSPVLTYPYSVAIQPVTDNVLISDPDGQAVFMLSPSGVQQAVFTAAQATPVPHYPNQVACDSAGNVYVANSNAFVVIKIDPTLTTQLLSFATSPALQYPTGVAVDAFNNVWVTDTVGERVVQFSAAGAVLATYTTASPSLLYPHGIHISKSGVVYVADSGNNRIIGITPPLTPSGASSSSSSTGAAATSTASTSSSSFVGSTNSSAPVPRPANGVLTACEFQGYNLTALTGYDLYYTDGNGTQWAARPCGVVSNVSYCSDTPSGGELCESSTTISMYDVSSALDSPGRAAIWAQLELDGQYGVAQFLQDGTYCADIDADREGTIVYVCNAIAATPFISSVVELSSCHYQAVIQTALLCPQLPVTGVSTAVGTNIVSDACGGTVYDLSGLRGQNIDSGVFYDTVVNNSYTYVLRVCDTSASTNCLGNVSVCQNYAPGLPGYTLGAWEPATSPVVWQYLGPGAVSMILQDGEGCGSAGAYSNRLTNVTFLCDPTAASPTITNALEGPTCSYLIDVATNLVCGVAFPDVSPLASPSSSSASAITYSSSTGTSAASSASSGGSSTALAGVVGDPQFVGLRGQSYQVHGIDGAVYNLIIDRGGMLVNARFTYRSFGRCPDLPQPTNCWSHPGSYLGEVGVLGAGGASGLHVVSGGWDTGFGNVTLDGALLSVGTNASAAGMEVWLLSAYVLRVRVGNFELLLENSDRFLNIVETRVLQWSALASHGLLGQTWRVPSVAAANKRISYVEGEVDDYVEQNNDILGDALVYGVEGVEVGST